MKNLTSILFFIGWSILIGTAIGAIGREVMTSKGAQPDFVYKLPSDYVSPVSASRDRNGNMILTYKDDFDVLHVAQYSDPNTIAFTSIFVK